MPLGLPRAWELLLREKGLLQAGELLLRGRGCSCGRGSGRGLPDEHSSDSLELLLRPCFSPVLVLLADLRDEVLVDRGRLVPPFVADVGEDGGDLIIFEHLAPRGHHVVELLAFYRGLPLKAMEDDFHDVIIAVPVL